MPEILSTHRSVGDVEHSFAQGVDIVTMPPKIFDGMYKHVLTDVGVEILIKHCNQFTHWRAATEDNQKVAYTKKSVDILIVCCRRSRRIDEESMRITVKQLLAYDIRFSHTCIVRHGLLRILGIVPPFAY